MNVPHNVNHHDGSHSTSCAYVLCVYAEELEVIAEQLVTDLYILSRLLHYGIYELAIYFGPATRIPPVDSQLDLKCYRMSRDLLRWRSKPRL